MDQTTQYFKALFEFKEPGRKILVWEKQGNPADVPKVSTWHETYQAAAEHCIRQANKKNSHIYAGVNLSPKDYGPRRRCGKDDIVGVTGLYTDTDIGTAYNVANKSGGKLQAGSLPETKEQALELITLASGAFHPSLIVYSGNGIHPYWLFKEVYEIETPEQREWIARLVARWQARIRVEAARAGWVMDSTQDLSRVLRVPGTWNIKDEAAPVLCDTVEYRPRARYEPADLNEFLESLPPDVAPVISFPGKSPVQAPNGALQAPGGLGQGDKAMPHIVRNPDASIAYHELRQLFDNNPKAKAAYEGKNKALSSWSERDLSISWAAWNAGWSEQKIFDLLVMFRREQSGGKHTDAARKILENRTYFGYTVARLREGWNRVEGSDKLFPEDDGDAFAAANAEHFSDIATARAQGDKGKLRAALRNLLGVDEFVTFHKMGPDNCHWDIELAGGIRVPIGETKELRINFIRLSVVLGEVGIPLRSFKAQQWDEIWRLAITSAVEHPHIDLSHSARVAQILQDFIGGQLDVSDDKFDMLLAMEKTFVRVSESGRKEVQKMQGRLCLFVPLKQFEAEIRQRGGAREVSMLQQRLDRLGFVRVVYQYSIDGKGRQGRTSRTYFQAPLDGLPPTLRASLPVFDIEGEPVTGD